MPRFPIALLASCFTVAALTGPAAAQALDLTLLRRALKPLAVNGVLKSRSTFQMTGEKQGVSFTFHEEASILAKRPGKFRADVIQFAAGGAPERRLLVVSDGSKVWTCRPYQRQYSVTTAKAFQAANADMTALGLAQGGFFLGDGHAMAQGFATITQANSPQAMAMLGNMGIHLTGKPQTVNGETLFVFRLVLIKQGVVYRFFVDPETAALRQMELTGQQNGVTIAFRETISSLRSPAHVPKTTFHFTPSRDMVKVAALSADPF